MRGNLRRGLERIEIPDEHDARVRAWTVVRGAFAEREPVRRRRDRRPALALALAAALVAGALSPAGEAVVDRVREAIGVEGAAPALFSLPVGRVLVESEAGAWIVSGDGSTRRLGPWREASWSPFGRFVVVARQDELAALTPDGDVRWKVARPDVALPRWSGSRTDTRIAYLTRGRLHVVAGDGTGDAAVAAARRVAPAWAPGSRHVLAYADARGRVVVIDAATRSVRFRTGPFQGLRSLAWSRRSRLLAVTTGGLVLFGADGQRVWRRPLAGIVAAAFAPDGKRIAVLRRGEVLLVDVTRPASRRRVFAGSGPLSGLAWSPDGRWLLVGWPGADQWVLVRLAGARRIQAVSSIMRQFESTRFPRVAGWCCPASS